MLEIAGAAKPANLDERVSMHAAFKWLALAGSPTSISITRVPPYPVIPKTRLKFRGWLYSTVTLFAKFRG